MSSPILLTSTHIKHHIPHSSLRQILSIEVSPELTSTHQALKERLKTSDGLLPQLLLAESQTQAIGQMNKTWHSPYAKNIYCSYACHLENKTTSLTGLSLMVGLSAAKTLQQCGAPDIQVKWPNDVYCQHKKIAGILVDTTTDPTGFKIIISIGINVNMTSNTPQIDQPWNSLYLVLGQPQDRNKIVGLFISQLYHDMRCFKNQGLRPFLAEWVAYDFLCGKFIQFKKGNKIYRGQTIGINENGHLLLKSAAGEIKAFASGEVIKK